MRRRVAFRSAAKQRVITTRPTVERLEDRLPPGDAVIGGLLAASWMAASCPCVASDPWASALSVAPRSSTEPGEGGQALSLPARSSGTNVVARSEPAQASREDGPAQQRNGSV